MLFVKTPTFIKKLIPAVTWDIPVTDKSIYITFDDGPTPKITEWVLEQLAIYNAKATFFCIGKNIEAHPEIFQQVVANQHSVGNHTFNHLNAWKTNQDTYLKNVLKAEKTLVTKYPKFSNRKLFRPPYGKFTPSIVTSLRKQGNDVIAWDIISEDYNQKLSPKKVLKNVLSNANPGSIIVFHDSVKAFKNLQYALPETLKELHKLGYTFKAL